MIKHSESISDKIFDVVNLIFVTICLVVVIYPLVYIVSASMSSPAAILSGNVKFLPVGFNLNGYQAVFKNAEIWTGFRNSIFYAVMVVLLNLMMTTIAAYPLSRKDFRFKNAILIIFTFTMYFGGGLIPTYVVIQSLGLVNTPLVMFVPAAMSVYYIILMKTYIQTTIPIEMQEAANIDGCGDILFVVRFVVPLSKPILAVLALYCAVSSWNDYFMALIYLSKRSYMPLQIFLRDVLVLNKVSPEAMSRIKDMVVYQNKMGLQSLLKYSLIVISSLPVLMIYPFVQKYFVKGVVLGAIKG